MPQSEFNGLMSGKIVGHSVWESALMSCEMMHMLDENSKTIETMEQKCTDTSECLQQLNDEIGEFKVISNRASVVMFHRPTSMPNEICLPFISRKN